MTMRTSPATSQIENMDPFVVIPPRKHSPSKHSHSTTPATPKSKSTPLHERFLEKVNMSPGSPTTPPHMPSKSPKQEPLGRQTLEVGQNGFYFSMEMPEKKVTARRAAMPDSAARGRRTPSPEKEKKSRVDVGGSVKDILRKSLFGSPTKMSATPAMDGGRERQVENGEVNGSLSKEGVSSPVSGLESRTSDSGSERNRRTDSGQLILPKGPRHDVTEGAATEHSAVPAPQNPRTTSQPSAPPLQIAIPSTADGSAMSAQADHTLKTQPSTPATTSITPAAPTLDPPRSSKTSTPSNIGHLMAGLSNKSSKVQTLPTAGGAESMPTPLRKMSERLGLRSPHVVRRGQTDGNVQSDDTMASKSDNLKSPISALSLRDAATAEDHPTASFKSCETATPTMLVASKASSEMLKVNTRAHFLGSLIAVASPIDRSRPSTATTASFAFPSTPLRPNAPSRSKSFGTPARLRSSIQEDMFKVQESLKRSLGPDFTLQTNGTRPTTPISSTETVKSSASNANHSKSGVAKVTRPVSTTGPAEANGVSGAHVVPRRPLNTAVRKPRPKSMIVGSAKMLETVASQIDSPRERAKLRSSAATLSSNRTGSSTSRPGTAASTSRKPVTAPTTLPSTKPQPTIRTTKSAALRAAAHPKRTTPSAPAAHPRSQGQRVVSAEAIASRVAEWKSVDRANATPKLPARTKSTKAPSSHRFKPSERAVKTPEPKDFKADSAHAESYTPPGNPTRLPSPAKSPSKNPLVVPTTPAPKTAAPASHAAKMRTPLPAKTPVNRRIDLGDPNAMRTPSKEIESSLDRAIDAKIAEDARAGKVWTPSGNRISVLLEAKRRR